MVAAEADDCFAALKLVRRIVQHEDAVLARAAPAAGAAAHPATPHSGNAAPPRIVPPPAAITEIA
jgi:flagellar protein FlbT